MSTQYGDESSLQAPFLKSSTRQTRYCCGLVGRNACVALTCTVTCLLIFTAIMLTIFVGGRAYAEMELSDSDITMKLTLSDFTDDSFQAAVVGAIDCRGSFDANLKRTTITMKYEGESFGTLPFPALKIAGGAVTDFNITATVQLNSNRAAFDKFAIALLQQETVSVMMSAKVTAEAMGISFSDLPFDKTVILRGYNNFAVPKPVVLSQSVNDGLADRIKINIEAELYNVGSIAMNNIGHMNLSVLSDKVEVGYAIADVDVTFAFGSNIIPMTVWLIRTDANVDSITNLLELYTTGGEVVLELHGNEVTTDIAILQPAMKELRTTASLQGLAHLEDKLFTTVYTMVDTSLGELIDTVNCSYTNFHYYTDSYIYAHNPLNVTVTLHTADFNVTWEGGASPVQTYQPFLFAYGRASNIGLVLAPGATVVYALRLCLADDDIMALIGFINYIAEIGADQSGVVPFSLYMYVDGGVVGTANAFENVNIPYWQEHVLTIARLKPH